LLISWIHYAGPSFPKSTRHPSTNAVTVSAKPVRSGQKIERVRKDTDRNYWMSAEEAVTYGMVSRVIRSVEELE